VLRCPALAGRITGVSSTIEPLVGHVLISGCLPSDESAGRSAESGGAHTRTSAPSARNRTAPTSGPTSPRPPYVDNNTRTSCPHFRRLWPRPTILRYDPGLAASPPVRYRLRVARREISLRLLLPSAGTDKLLAKRRRAAYGGTRRWPRSLAFRTWIRMPASWSSKRTPSTKTPTRSICVRSEARWSRRKTENPISSDPPVKIDASHVGTSPQSGPTKL
jgi:hypothetical protein